MSTPTIDCWICGKPHPLFWLEGRGCKKEMCITCNAYPKWGEEEVQKDGKMYVRKTKRSVTRMLVVTKEYRHILPKELEGLPVKVSTSRSKELAKQNQLEMLPLLRRKP